MALNAASTPLLDRERELEALMELIDASPRRGRVAVVGGPAGIGKTSLVGAFAASVPPERLVLTATGGELERGHSFGIVRQLFVHTLLGLSRSRRDALLGGAAAHAAAALGFPGIAADTAGTLHGLYWMVAGLAAEGPLLMLVDDAHWADEPSLAFIHYLARRVEDLAVVLVVAHRDDEPSGGQELVALIRDLPDVEAIDPAPLSAHAVETLVAEILCADPASSFSAECGAVTGGNPFLLLELLRAARADGLTGSSDQTAVIRQLTPRTISRAVTARLARTPESARRLARAVSVLGTDAHLGLAARLADLDTDAAREAADQLRDAGVLRPGQALEFVHPLVRTSVRGGIRPGARSIAHRRAAKLLADAGYPAGEIAAHVHLTEPGDDAWVVAALRKAADVALAQSAPMSATTHLERLLAEPVPATERGSVLRELGELLHGLDPLRARAP